MKKSALFLYHFLLILFPIYLLLIFYSQFSLAGFWSDIYFTLILILFSIIFVFKRNQLDKWFSRTCKTIQIGCLGVCAYFIISNLNNSVFWGRTETKTFSNITIQNQTYNAYFHPVKLFTGGYGNVSVTRKLSFLPIFEYDVCLIKGIKYDLSEDVYEGYKLDHTIVLKELISEKLGIVKIKPIKLQDVKFIYLSDPNEKSADSLQLNTALAEKFINKMNHSENIGLTKGFLGFELVIHLKSGEQRRLNIDGNIIKESTTNDAAFKAKDLSFLKRFWNENEQNIPSRIILRQGNKELSSFELNYEQKWAVKPKIFPYSNYSKIRAFKLDCSGECFKAEFRYRTSEGKEISKKQFDNLMKILKNPNSYGNSTAACFNPGFALVLYDEKDIPTEFMSFCLDCNSFRTYPGEINVKYKNEMLYGFSKEARTKLRTFFLDCGVDYQNKSSLFD